MEGLKWRKASHSGANGGNCVEVARAAHQIAARDSKNPDGGTIWISSADWRRFITEIKSGLLDS
ncbi:DUF397 domain-containing protein [Actinomadura alba]|uniref:DUF397 domain-containing protein n=1 Tax=Actinomadura alba TaxID=406431 RepID=A0ABR7LZ93_9ACTN|nr:DUF397 domain-containing protein [Actinomadura alba]MBC6470167.1 DUF397 domain-containing protein [Actinomadura alba]